MNTKFTENELNIYLKFDTSFETVFDLSFLLVDLQTLISGFEYSIEASTLESLSGNYAVAEKFNGYSIADEIIKTIDNIIPMDEYKKERVKDEVSSLVDRPKNYLIAQEDDLKAYRTSSRNFLKKRKNNLKLREFQQGSLILDIVGTVIGGIILTYVSKIIFQETKNPNIVNINIQNQKIAIYKNGKVHTLNEREQRLITLENSNSDFEVSSVASLIDDIFSDVPTHLGNNEEAVRSLLLNLEERKLIPRTASYDQRAIKTIIRDVEKLKGNLLDIKK
ncbi:hypothetical protein [Paenibacillus sp. WC2504]|uniref:hypothetical protein n=1 Tax=Paenibacillus sp. WC2504 TaxID=3461403 RepID=UPI00404539E6